MKIPYKLNKILFLLINLLFLSSCNSNSQFFDFKNNNLEKINKVNETEVEKIKGESKYGRLILKLSFDSDYINEYKNKVGNINFKTKSIKGIGKVEIKIISEDLSILQGYEIVVPEKDYIEKIFKLNLGKYKIYVEATSFYGEIMFSGIGEIYINENKASETGIYFSKQEQLL